MKPGRLKKSFAILLAAGLVVAACGGDDDDDGGGASATTAADSGDGGSTETTAADSGDGGSTETTEAAPTATDAEANPDTDVSDDSAGAQYGGTLTVGLEAEATGLRPWEDACSAPCYTMMTAIYDKLIEQDETGQYQPWLAESITPNEDFTVWTLTLRPGVTFHNGTELTAQTIADMFPIQQEGANSSGAISTANLANVEATGDLEVTYTLSQSNSAFPAALGRSALGMPFDPAAAAADPTGYSTNPIGTGPFMMQSRDLDNETVVVRNPDYWGVDPEGNQLPYLDEISFRPIPDEGTRLDALLSGTVNVMQTLRQGTIRDARAARDGGDDIVLIEYQGNNTGGGMYNVAVAPFDDVRVRMGLTLMNSQEKVIEALGGTGISLPATQWFSPDSAWWTQEAADAWPRFDFEAGVASITEYVNDPERTDGKAAGEPIDVELSCPPDPTLIAAMQVLEQTWTASGMVNVTLTNYDQQTHINIALGADNGFIGTHQAHCWRWGSEDDPAVPLNPFLAPPTAEIAEAAGIPGVVSPLNFSNWFSPEAFGDAVAALQTDDFETRKNLYKDIMILIAQDVPIWYSGHTATAFGTAPNVHGLNGWHLPSGDLGIGMAGAEGRLLETYISDN